MHDQHVIAGAAFELGHGPESGLGIGTNRPDIGGRYSALSYFGLVPAALIGVDLEQMLASAAEMAALSQEAVASNPAAWLGAVYQDVFGRAIDAGGQQSLLQLLGQGVSRFTITQALLVSREGVDFRVNQVYLQYLDRNADAGGLSFFSPLVQQGLRPEIVAQMLVDSDEYLIQP